MVIVIDSDRVVDDDAENRSVIEAVSGMLKPEGIFVMDYLNASKLGQDICTQEVKRIDDKIFHISRETVDRYIEKRIRFEADGKVQEFMEKVRLYDPDELKSMFESQGLRIISTFGSYSLSPFDSATSDRLILVAQKT